MSIVNHTGHPINAANFESLLGFLIAMGADYDPVNLTLKLPFLQGMYVIADGHLQLVKDTTTSFDRGTNIRENEFEPIKKLCTKLVNALIACRPLKQTIDDARTINRKIQGGRAAEKIQPVVPTTEEPLSDLEIIAKNISVSQQNVDFVLDNFIKLVTLLDNEPLYIPNEVPLQVVTLKAKIVTMKKANSDVKLVAPLYTKSLSTRNVYFYTPETGMVDSALVVKSYCLSVLDSSSDLYKKIKALHFRNFKI